MMMKLINLVRRRGQGSTDSTVAAAPAPKPPPLPGKLLAELTGLEAMVSRRPDDRRRRPRLDLGRSTVIDTDLATPQRTLDADVRDFSAEGIAIELDVALAIGTRFRMTIPKAGGDALVSLTYTVRRCDPLPTGRYDVGGALLEYVS